MRQVLVVALLLGFANHPSTVTRAQQHLWVTIAYSDGPEAAAVRVDKTTMYLGGPSAGVAPLPSSTADVWFFIRAWQDADKAQVLVFARLSDKRAPSGFTETPIATFAVASGQSVEVKQSEQWGGPPLKVAGVFR